VYSEFSSNLHF